MMLPITGTIRDAVKLAELDNKWKQKKNSAEKNKKELTPEEKQIQRYKEDAQKMRESRQMASLDAKLEAGAGLTPEEIAYLRKNHPQKYKDYLEAKKEQEYYKEELETCETKEDVEKLKMTKVGKFAAECKSIVNNPSIPKGKKVELLGKILKELAGVQKVHAEFVKSLKYQSLPTDQEAAEEKRAGIEPETESERETETELGKESEKELSAQSADKTAALRESEKELDKEAKKEPVFSETDKDIEIDFEKIETEIKEYLKPYRA